jgi:hypothetical protein
MRRQNVLRRDPPLKLLVVLDEAVLRRTIGDESVMYEQLQRLAEVDLPGVTVRVLPFAVHRAVVVDSFVVFSFGEENAILHDVVATEGLKSEFYVEGEQETHLHRVVFERLLSLSLGPEQSKKLILEIAQSLWRN